MLGALGATLALATVATGCGSDGSDYANADRPPAPLSISIAVTADRIAVSPDRLGGGPVVLLIANESGRSREVTLAASDGADRSCVADNASSGPINPQDAARITLPLVEGTCEVGVADGTLRPARLIVGPERSRAEFRALICSARHSIRILDHKLSDPDLVGLLRERRGEGITVTVLGKQPMRGIEPHGKMMIIDGTRAVLGSTALSTLSLDFRREVSVVVHDAALVKQLNVSFQELDAKAGVAATRLPGDRTA